MWWIIEIKKFLPYFVIAICFPFFLKKIIDLPINRMLYKKKLTKSNDEQISNLIIKSTRNFYSPQKYMTCVIEIYTSCKIKIWNSFQKPMSCCYASEGFLNLETIKKNNRQHKTTCIFTIISSKKNSHSKTLLIL